MDNKIVDDKSNEIEETLENEIFIEEKTNKVQDDILNSEISNALVEINSNQIKDLIYTIRGEQVMMDSDLAILYEVSTKRLNEQVKRNIERFPEKFMFRLTDEEYSNLRSQIATSSSDNNYGGRRYNPYVFNQQGIAMLSAVLKSNVAIQISIKIMDAFVEMRHFLVDNRNMFSRINSIELNQLNYQHNMDTRLNTFERKQLEYQKNTDKRLKQTDEKFEKVFDYIAKNKEVKQKIFFDGQIYDAYSLLASIVKKATKSIILIDNYVDTVTLDILSKRKKNIKIDIYTSKKAKLTDTEIDKFNKQYGNLSRNYTETFHDRFMILDESICYHIGSSIKDALLSTFANAKAA